MIHVHAPSRVHFGLLHVPTAEENSPRSFGGVGLAIQDPGVRLGVVPARTWAAEGPSSSRALGFAEAFAEAIGTDRRFALRVESAAPEHVGLGSGTQLALATARGISEACGLPGLPACELARIVGRGARSGIGVHGFAQGGFLIDGGKKREGEVAPLLVRKDWPGDWHVVLFLPERMQGLHGKVERSAFSRLGTGGTGGSKTEGLCRLVLLGLLPALVEEDLPTFGEALYEFNRKVGEIFAPVQGGLYAEPGIESLIGDLRSRGVRGVGQSSWGPTVFAVVHREEFDLLPRSIPGVGILRTQGCNTGAISTGIEPSVG